MNEAEQNWHRYLRNKHILRLGGEREVQYCEAQTLQDGDQSKAADQFSVEQFSLKDEDELRLAQLARNMMILMMRTGR